MKAMSETSNQMIVHGPSAHPYTRSCADPIPVERAERKGAAVDCQRRGLGVPALAR